MDAGLCHDFLQSWAAHLYGALNSGHLPDDYFALIERRVQKPNYGFLTLDLSSEFDIEDAGTGGLAVATKPPTAQLVQRTEADIYAAKANRITVRHRHGDVVAVVEIVSPGNKGSRAEFHAFVSKSIELIRGGINLLVIDLLPLSPRDPQGIHRAIWDEFDDQEHAPPQDKPLTIASYDAGTEKVAYVDFVAVGDSLPETPLFLRPGFYVPAPLEASYETSWSNFPNRLKGLLAGT